MAAAIDTLPDWAALNDLDFFDVRVENTEAHGLGLVADRVLTRVEDTFDIPTLLRIPKKLVLSAEAVELYAKVDMNFRQLLDAAGGQSTRGDILLFLLANLVMSTRSPASKGGGVPTPWTQYVKYLPTRVPVPTLWNDYERQLLEGTSLEPAVTAKLAALSAEFNHLREAVADILYWNDLIGEEGLVSLEDWLLMDAWYRSRSLELPRAGPAMVPVLDMANHAAAPTAYYDEDASGRGTGDVVLLLRSGCRVGPGEELTISYGADKSAAEMLFSYGFVDDAAVPGGNKIVLPLDPLPDDPLARAKLYAFSGPRTIEITHRATTNSSNSDDEDAAVATVSWTSPFAHFATLNEEDGLEFRVLQTTQGERQLRVFWLDADVTDRTADFAALTAAHPTLAAVFRLRVFAVLADRVRAQLDRLRSASSQVPQVDGSAAFIVRGECVRAATALRKTEEEGLAVALLSLEEEKSRLLDDATVVAYLGSMETSQSAQAASPSANDDEDDFS